MRAPDLQAVAIVLALAAPACKDSVEPARSQDARKPAAADTRTGAVPAADASAVLAPDPSTSAGFREAMVLVCESPTRSGAMKEEDPAERAKQLADWIFANVEDEEVLRMLGGMATLAPDAKIEKLRSEARRAGIARCEFADMSEAEMKARPAP